MCCLINTCDFFRHIQIKFSYHQVISLLLRNIYQNESDSIDRNFDVVMSKKNYLLSCGFMKLFY